MNTLVFCFDGTWNGRDDSIPTNVLKIHLGIECAVSFYFAGPGNEDESNFFERIFGGAFGIGSSDIRDDAMSVLGSVYQGGDRIVVIGFSRGAAIARMFCAKIAIEGVNGHFPLISFLGCFDTVAAFLPFGDAQQGTLFHDMNVGRDVVKAVHAVALDETRDPFTPNLMNARQGVEEVWFAGVHSDIGGGGDTTLSNITLDWMMRRMREQCISVSHKIMAAERRYETTVTQDDGIMTSPRRVGVKRDGEFTEELPMLHSSVTPSNHPNLKG